MLESIQKASMWKRISAYLCDFIALAIVSVGFAFLLSSILGYTDHNDRLENYYAEYGKEYGVDFEIGNSSGVPYTEEEQRLFDSLTEQYKATGEYDFHNFEITWEKYGALSKEDKIKYDFQYSVAYEALTSDEDVLYTFNMVINLTLLIATIGILLGYIITEFIVPIIFKNGQTLGKKVFGIAVMREDSVKMSNVALFIRTILGKYTIETMIPAYIIVLIFFNAVGIVGTVILGLILLLQIIMLSTTKNRCAIHDILAGTVTVDMQSQRIFETKDDLIAYKNKIHEDFVSKAEYK